MTHTTAARFEQLAQAADSNVFIDVTVIGYRVRLSHAGTAHEAIAATLEIALQEMCQIIASSLRSLADEKSAEAAALLRSAYALDGKTLPGDDAMWHTGVSVDLEGSGPISRPVMEAVSQ